MVDERVYKLKNGQEKILLARANFNDKRYLLLSDNETDDFEIGYEEDNKLIYLKKNDPSYTTILSMLYNKLKSEEN